MTTRSRFERPSRKASSDVDVLVVHGFDTGEIGAAMLVHIEPAGKQARKQALIAAKEIQDSVGWGKARCLQWIGEHFDMKPPEVGKLVLHDGVYAAPLAHWDKLFQQYDKELNELKTQQTRESQKPELDIT